MEQDLAGGLGIPAKQGPVYEIADTDGERNAAEGRDDPGFRLARDSSNDSERDDEADRSGNEKNAAAAGASRLIELGFGGNGYTAGDGGHTLFGAELAHAIVRVHESDWNSHTQSYRHQTD